tara:strand:- start:155179 stop:156006 length:828 start_codon:yes stop_codon:yes gene_type:complete
MVIIIKAITFILLLIQVSHAQNLISNFCEQSDQYVSEYNRALKNEQYLPQYQIESPEQAYLIQACLVAGKAQKIIGFKAGLVSRSAQHKFGANEPVLGVLTEGNLTAINAIVKKSNATSLIEVELAFRLKQSIEKLADLNKDIIGLVDAVAPAIEVPLFHFKDVNTLTSNDIISANVGADIFMLGEFVPIEEIDINSIKVSLFENNKLVAGSEHINTTNRWNALMWLIRKSYLEGYDLNKGTVYLTGSLVKPVILGEAEYYADFKRMKNITLTVR